MCVQPDDPCAASDLFNLSIPTDRVQRAVRHHWGRLDHGWQSYARAGVDVHYDKTVREIACMAATLAQTGDSIEAAD